MDTSWEQGDTLAQWAETPSGEVVDRVNLGTLARIRYWARRRIRPTRAVEPDEALTGVMPATDWAAL